MHILSILSLLEQMELAVGRLYRHYAETISGDSQASAFFFRMSLEERSHASIIRYQKNLAWKNPQLFSMSPVDIQEVREVTGKANRLAEDPRVPTLVEALIAASEFETGAAELHYRIAVRTEQRSFNSMVSRLGGADRTHAESIAEFSYGRGLCLYLQGARTHAATASGRGQVHCTVSVIVSRVRSMQTEAPNNF